MVAPRLVLTSAHVVARAGASVVVFRPGRAGAFTATVAWCGTPGGRDDAALVVVDDPDWNPVGLARVCWGRSVTHRPGIGCESWGVPNLVQRPDRSIEVEQLSGTLNPGDRMVGDRYLMKLTSHPPVGTSPWGGLSGAAMFCGDLLTGVIVSDPADRAHAALETVPISLLLSDPGFAAVIDAHTGSTGPRCEPVELRPLADVQAMSWAGAPVTSPAGLLPARRAVVPFHGREDLLADLDGWGRLPGLGVWLLHGPGGQGKTRLALHFADQIAREGWAVLWLHRNSEAVALQTLAEVRVPALIVLDYAESRTGQFAELAEVLARRPDSIPVKLLLLARTAGAWWIELPAAGDTVRDLVDTARVASLPVLDDSVEARQDSYRGAVTAFAAALRRVPGQDQQPWEVAAATLTGRSAPAVGGRTVLAVQMVALADLLDTANLPATSPGNDAGREPEDRLLDHERGYWRTAAHAGHLDLTEATLADVVAATVLLGPATLGELDAVLARIPAVADLPADRREAVRGWVLHLYPGGKDQTFDSLAPDRLAERLVGRLLLDASRPSVVEGLATQASEVEAERLLIVATRAAAHAALGPRVGDAVTAVCLRHPALLVPAIRAATRLEQPGPLLRALDQRITDPSTGIAMLQRLSGALPERSQVLAETAVGIAQALVERHRQTTEESPTQETANGLAMSLNTFSVRLGDVGRWEEGLAAITEAVGIRRRLAEQRPDAFLPNLATSLNNLAVRLGGLGRWEEELAAITEAVGIRRRLAEQRPDAFLPNLAMSLNNLAVRLGGLGRWEEGLAAITEAVGIRRRLAEQRPAVHRAALDQSLRVLEQLQSMSNGPTSP
ncbi:tetratricopeptide repeat protein [Amycolatopsis sp. H20-H5]|uniref:tetratricopeptide repeat protein n=1 Tax=Amycolatopsis sp. H20-H5 TaxID=3046309 RepID=UPI002DBCB6BD|nr:tetratricopeptide repeat protein [Amycolatopsis sp. H20-H5]MEC3974292.1 tetratricopeptide repeat protein [Amycolatopsis sp. H20-H5]